MYIGERYLSNDQHHRLQCLLPPSACREVFFADMFFAFADFQDGFLSFSEFSTGALLLYQDALEDELHVLFSGSLLLPMKNGCSCDLFFP